MEELGLEIAGRPIEVRYARGLRDTAGNEAHAATFIRRRVIVLHTDLRRNLSEHARILSHELLHFAWVRLGNARRADWKSLLQTEWLAGVRGEAGWSAEWRKQLLTTSEDTLLWRDYCCEAFCDTGSAIWSGVSVEVTLPRRILQRRAAWFLAAGKLPV